MKKKKKMAYGGSLTTLETPGQAIAQNRIDIAKAKQQASANPWVIGLNTLGAMGIQYGTSMMSSGMTGTKTPVNTDTVGKSMGVSAAGGNGGLFAGMMKGLQPEMAFGGKVKGNVEIEGEEVLEIPSGKVMEAKGPKHEQGGIDTLLPIGTEVFSDRIRLGKKTMAERKKDREQSMSKLEKLMEKSSNDKIIKNSKKRTKTKNQIEEAHDLELQEVIDALMNVKNTAEGKGKEQFDFGGTVGDIWEKSGMADMSTGDMVGIAGNLVSMFGPMSITKQSRSTDTPHTNHFENYGEDGLETIEEAKGYIDDTKNEALRRLTKSSNASKSANRKTARGVNTMRALDLATDQQANDAQHKIYADVAERFMRLLQSKAGMENKQDQMKMRGDYRVDMSDRADKDNYYSNLAQNWASMGQGIQQTGKDLNQVEQNRITTDMINQLSDYFKFNKNNEVVGKSSTGLPKGATYNEATGTYTVNGVTLTEEQFNKLYK